MASARPGVTILQSLLVLTLTNAIQANDYQTRALNALASEMARCLGLHVLSSASVIFDSGRRFSSESLCRLFWAHTYLDRVVSAMTGQLPGVQWRHVQTPGNRINNQDLQFTYFITVCILWRTFDTTIDEVYTPTFDNLSASAKRDLHVRCQAQLRAFYTNDIPRVLIPSSSSLKDAAPEVLYFHIAYHTATLLMNRPFLIETGTGANSSVMSSIKQSTFTICKAIQLIHKRSTWSEVPAALLFHIVRVCAVLLLLATSSSTSSQRQAAANLKICLRALEACCEVWPTLARRSINAVRILAERWRVTGVGTLAGMDMTLKLIWHWKGLLRVARRGSRTEHFRRLHHGRQALKQCYA
ncbi:hypothetical protein M409DRAFT_61040 [Zasmidium cellare ATCC 36951]|uniref:Xylanolytic transcriptional activator regulatory domain-containing protein n=1 Tax=Zasmidium cellare ATCC 36951 TaxID=1080233 RepID=A0A6A6BWM9_ZASCE|nr:uncharacterized protein M409DRAFT_61040 [Zasmidium cellare ATCC 36951]KAF2159221.1 hypothetical protein M409DRAFT_61040 [Zasmidium cellare ATCC 36951]